MEKSCHTGFSVFFTTSVLWQIVKLKNNRFKIPKKKKQKVKSCLDVFILMEQNFGNRNQLLSAFVLAHFDVSVLLLYAQTKRTNKNSRAILIASVEDHEGVRLSKKVLFIQFVSAELHCSTILRINEHK